MSTETIHVSPELRRGRNQLAATVVVGHAVKHIYNSALQSILFPEIKIGLGLSGTQLGTLAFSRQATSWVTTVFAGFLGDRFADRASLMLGISLLMTGVSYYLLGIADNVVSENLIFIAVLAIMLLIGVGPSLYHPPAIGALSRRFPDRRGFAISLHGTGGSVGEVAGPLLAGVVLLGWLAMTWDSRVGLQPLPRAGVRRGHMGCSCATCPAERCVRSLPFRSTSRRCCRSSSARRCTCWSSQRRFAAWARAL